MHFDKCDEWLFKLCFDFEIGKYLKNFQEERLKCKKNQTREIKKKPAEYSGTPYYYICKT